MPWMGRYDTMTHEQCAHQVIYAMESMGMSGVPVLE